MKSAKLNPGLILAAAAATVFTPLACAGVASFAAQPPDVSTSPSPSVAVPTQPTIRYSAGTLTDRIVRRLGQSADQFTFRVRNDTSSTVKYDFATGQQINLIVTDATGAEIWNYGKSRQFSPLITHHTLKKGQALTYTVLWAHRDQSAKPVPAGDYTVTASLKTMPRLVVSRTSTVDPLRENGDPTNVGVTVSANSSRSADVSQTGDSQQNDIAPSISAKITVTVPPTP